MTEKDESFDEENNEQKDSLQKEKSHLQKRLGGVLLEVQQERKEKGKILTRENALEALEEKISTNGQTKDLLGKLIVLLGKPEISFSDLAEVELDGYKTLQHQFSRVYCDQLDEVNKRGTLSAHTKHLKSILKPHLGTGSKSFNKYLKHAGFPEYNSETGRWEVGGKEFRKLPKWDTNYFVQLRNQVDGYLDYLHDRGDGKSFNTLVGRLENNSLSIGKIVAHFSEIGLYDGKTVTKAIIVGGKGDRVTSAKKYSKTFRRMVDPVNLIEGLLDMTSETEVAELLDKQDKKRVQTRDSYGNRGGDINRSLKEKYSIKQFEKVIKNSWVNEQGNEKRFEKEYYERCILQAKEAGDSESVLLAESMMWVLSGKEALPKSRIDELRTTYMKSLSEQKITLAKSLGVYDLLKANLEEHSPALSSKRIDQYIESYQQFWKDFYDPDVVDHKITDAQGNEYTFAIKKNIRFLPESKEYAEGIGDLFHMELEYTPELGPEGNHNLMAVMAKEDVLDLYQKVEMYPEEKEQEIVLQKSQKYRIYGPKGEIIEGYTSLESVDQEGDDEVVYNKKGKVISSQKKSKYRVKITDTHIVDGTISDMEGIYPFGEKGKSDRSDLLKGWKFEPIDKEGNTEEISFKVKLGLGKNDTHSPFNEWSTRNDKMIQLMIGEQLDKEKIPLAELEKFDGENMAGKLFAKEKFENEQALKNREKMESRYMKTQVVSGDMIPKELIAKTPSNDIHGWNHEGQVYLNNDHFKKLLGGDGLLDPIHGLVDENGFIVDFEELNAWVNEEFGDEKEYIKRLSVLLEIRKITLHEKAHRIFYYYGIVDESVPHVVTDRNTLSKKGSLVVTAFNDPEKQLLLSNETLCEISEGRLFKNKDERILENIPISHEFVQVKDAQGVLQDAVIIEGDDKNDYTILIKDIENIIRKKDPGLKNFTFKDILDIDERLIDDLEKGGHIEDVFAGLLEARSDREPIETITRQLVNDNVAGAVYLFADNAEDKHLLPSDRAGQSGLAGRIGGAPNAIPIPLGANATTPYTTPMTPQEAKAAKKQIKKAMKKIKKAVADGKRVVLPVNPDGTSALGNDLAGNPNAQDILDYLDNSLKGEDSNLSNAVPPVTPENPVPETPDQTNDRLQEQENERIDSERRLFDDAFNALKGDESITGGPEVDQILMLRDSASTWPGGASDWIKLKIIGVSDDEITFEFSGHSEKNAGAYIGQPFDIPRTEAGINHLKNNAKGEVYKYKSLGGKREFLDYKGPTRGGLPSAWEKVDYKGMKEFVDGGEGKKEKRPVTHVAVLPAQVAPYKLTRSIYEVEWGSHSVTLTTTKDTAVDKKGKVTAQEKIVQTMDYTMFSHFCRDKKLEPFSKYEVDRAVSRDRTPAKKDSNGDGIHEETIAPKSSRRDKLMSISGIIATIKKFPETFKVKQEQEAKLQATGLFNNILKGLPDGLDGGLLYLSDIKADALAEVDATAMQIIEDYKSRLTRADIGEGAHGGLGSKIIKKQIFDKKITKRTDRLKAAGYFLYAIENGGNPYQRALQTMEGSGTWVLKLLGPEYQEEFLAEQKHLTDLLQSGTGDFDEVQDRLAKLELHYIVSRTLDHPFYGTRFARAVEDKMDKRGKVDALDGVKDGVGSKGNFYDIYNGFRGGGITNMLPHVFMGSIMALEANIEEPKHYKMFYQSIIIALTSGYTKQFSKAYMDKFKGLCRRTGIPLGMFISDANSAGKSVGVIDYISRKAKIQPSLSDAISQTIYGKKGLRKPDELNVTNFNKDKQVKKVQVAVENRWENNGKLVMDSFNYKEKFLVEGLADNNSLVNEYFGDGVVFNSYNDYKDSAGSMPDGDNPVYEGIFNLAPGTFQSYMMSFSGRGFQKEKTYEMWKKFDIGVGSFETLFKQISSAEARTPRQQQQKQQKMKLLMKFLMKKRKVYFGKNVGKTGFKLMRGYLLGTEGTGQGNDGIRGVEGVKKVAGVTIYNDNEYKINEDNETLERNGTRGYANSVGSPPIVKSSVDRYIDLIVEGLGAIGNEDKEELVNTIFVE